MEFIFLKIKTEPRIETSNSVTRWDAESAILNTEFEYPGIESEEFPTLSQIISQELIIEKPFRQLIIGDIEIVIDNKNRFQVIDVRTNPRLWQADQLSARNNLEKVWVEFEIEYDINQIASINIESSIFWDSMSNVLLFRFSPYRETTQWYSISNNLYIGVDDDNALCDLTFLKVIIGNNRASSRNNYID